MGKRKNYEWPWPQVEILCPLWGGAGELRVHWDRERQCLMSAAGPVSRDAPVRVRHIPHHTDPPIHYAFDWLRQAGYRNVAPS